MRDSGVHLLMDEGLDQIDGGAESLSYLQRVNRHVTLHEFLSFSFVVSFDSIVLHGVCYVAGRLSM